jgi:hypothetical protein
MSESLSNPEKRTERALLHSGPVAPGGLIRKVWVARLRPFSVATLVVFGWSACEPWNYAAAMAAPKRAPAPGRLERVLAHVDETLREARRASSEIKRQADQGQDLSPGLESLSALWEEIDAAKPEVEASFESVGGRLRKARVPHESMQRHENALAADRAELAGLRGRIECAVELHREHREARDKGRTAEAAARYKELEDRIGQISVVLREKAREPRHRALDPLQLPHRGSTLPRREPRLSQGAFEGIASAAEEVAAKGKAPVLGLKAAAALPGPGDLGETLEVRLTPGIRALAAQLNNEPVRIYGFVRDQIEFVPTHGSIQGAEGCLKTRLCNDLDTASLLIALLRAAGVPARYAMGTVEMPIARAQSWLGGFSNARAALDFAASAGTPTAGVSTGPSSLVAARLEHVWVEAFVDFVPSRGAVRGTGDTWVPLDASFKELTIIPGIDLDAAAGDFNAKDFFEQIAEGATVADPDGAVSDIDVAAVDRKFAELRDRIATYVSGQGTPLTLGDLSGRKTVVPQTLSVLPASLPYEVLVRGASFAEVPDSLRHKLLFEVTSAGSFTPDISYRTSLPALAGKRVTLGYLPATAADQAVLESFIPTAPDATLDDLPETLPAYLIRVRPELRIDGAVVAAGASSTLGETGQFSLVFSMPQAGQQRVDNDITAGTYNAIVLNLGRVEDPVARLASSRAIHERLRAGDTAGIGKDDVVGEFFYGAGLLYWSELEMFERIAKDLKKVVTARLPSEGIFTQDLKVSYLFGTPHAVSRGGATTDIDTNVQAAAARDGNAIKEVDFLSVTGTMSSGAESAIYDQMVNAQPTGAGITAVSYLEAAARQGIPIFHINRDNIARALPKLQVSEAVKQDIQNAINADRVVTIPQREFAKDGFTGVGYIVFDLNTGAGAYLISGGLAGGTFSLPHDTFAIFMISMLLVIFSIFASPLIAAILTAIAVVLALYDYIGTMIDIMRDNPNLDAASIEAIAGLLAALVVLPGLLAVFGFGSLLVLVAFAVYFVFASAVVPGILSGFLVWLSRQGSDSAWLRPSERVEEELDWAQFLRTAGGEG